MSLSEWLANGTVKSHREDTLAFRNEVLEWLEHH